MNKDFSFPRRVRAVLVTAALTGLALTGTVYLVAPARAGAVDHDGEITVHEGREVELLLSESQGKAYLRLWGNEKGKPVALDPSRVQAVLARPGGQTEHLTFKADAGGLISRQQIAEPHFFELQAEIAWPGLDEPVQAELKRAEGMIALSSEQVALAGIKTEAADAGALAASNPFPGEIRFNADRTAHVVPRMTGVVQAVQADLGQQVKKGDLLAVISSTALSELRSEWLAAVKRRDLAVQTYRRERRLWLDKVSAEQDYQQANAAFREAEIAVRNAEQKLLVVGATPTDKDLGRLEIRAPFDSVVVEKHIALGEALADNANIFTLSDLRTVWAEFLIAAKDLASVRVGEAAEVSSTAFAGRATGKVSYIGSLLGQQTRTATARVTLDNPDMAWRPGLFVTVDVVVQRVDAKVVVQADAVQTLDSGPVVFVEVPGGFAAQPVKLGKSSGSQVEVLAGVAPGTRYVTENAFVLKSEMGKASADHAH